MIHLGPKLRSSRNRYFKSTVSHCQPETKGVHSSNFQIKPGRGRFYYTVSSLIVYRYLSPEKNPKTFPGKLFQAIKFISFIYMFFAGRAGLSDPLPEN